jgi:pSer/pThr/pTyr-binding forkhead associated (FHA) protein
MENFMAARLHYLLRDIAVPEGAFLIGRGSECQLALNDAQVSRRHAVLRVDAGGAVIEDLDSRNGVLLNGVRIDKAEPLHDGDQIRIGAQDLAFHNAEETPSRRVGGGREALATLAEIQIGELRQLDPDDPSERTFVATGPMTPNRLIGLSIIGGVADKALALGRADEAERILQRALADTLLRAGSGEVDGELAERAAEYALRLAATTGRGSWIDYVFQLYTALGAILPAWVVDELYAAVRRVKHIDKSVLAAYTARLREVSTGFGPAERFVLQRIEGLERWAP